MAPLVPFLCWCPIPSTGHYFYEQARDLQIPVVQFHGRLADAVGHTDRQAANPRL
jgi:hypothetical protein